MSIPRLSRIIQFCIAFIGSYSRSAPLLSPSGPSRRMALDSRAVLADGYCGNISEAPIFTQGDVDYGGPGFLLKDQDYDNTYQQHYYFLYENGRDNHPWKYTTLQPGTQCFISVCQSFSGRLVRGNPTDNLDGTTNHNLGTWIEIAWDSPPSTSAWADVSLLEGYDGAAFLNALDGSGISAGFVVDILSGAPENCTAKKTDGSLALAKTVGTDANDAARSYEMALLSPTQQAFIVQAFKPVIGSKTGRFLVSMYTGTY